MWLLLQRGEADYTSAAAIIKDILALKTQVQHTVHEPALPKVVQAPLVPDTLQSPGDGSLDLIAHPEPVEIDSEPSVLAVLGM